MAKIVTHLKVVTNTFRLQHPSPTSMLPLYRLTHLITPLIVVKIKVVKVRSDLDMVRVSKQLIAIAMNNELTFYCFLWIVPSSNYAIISFRFDLVFKNLFIYIYILYFSWSDILIILKSPICYNSYVFDRCSP